MRKLFFQTQRKFIVYFMFIIINLYLRRHFDINSVRFVNKPTPLNQAIATFSVRHKSHFRKPHL